MEEPTAGEYKEMVAQMEIIIKELSEANASLSLGQGAKNAMAVTVDGVLYRVAIPKFKHNGILCTATDIISQPQLAAELVASGSGVLKRV